MRRWLLALFLGAFSLVVAESAEKNSKEQKDCYTAKNASETEENDPIPTLAHLDGEPSAFVNNAVNAITGSFCETAVDLIAPGPNPITLERSYASSDTSC